MVAVAELKQADSSKTGKLSRERNARLIEACDKEIADIRLKMTWSAMGPNVRRSPPRLTPSM